MFSSGHIIKILEKHGFIFVSQRGSHVKYRLYGPRTLTVIVPAGRREIPWGTFKSILRQACLEERDFQ
jgi:predicted RNA binding protein YcfA (HicA-like mRNA interferase family)